MIRRLLLTIAATFLAQAAMAQPAEPLFVHRVTMAAEAVRAPMGVRAEVISRVAVGLRIDRLFGVLTALTLSFAWGYTAVFFPGVLSSSQASPITLRRGEERQVEGVQASLS